MCVIDPTKYGTASEIAEAIGEPRNTNRRNQMSTFRIASKGFKFGENCVRCGDATDMRDKRDGYLLMGTDGEYHVLCRHCNSHVHKVGTDEEYGIDGDGDFCRTGKKFSIVDRNPKTQYSPTGTQPEDVDDGSAY